MAKTITISLPHHLTREQARQKIMTGVAQHKQQFGHMAQVEDRWAGDRMEFKASSMGQSLTGRVDVTDEAVVVHVDLPWALAMLAGKIKGQIEGEGRKLLESK